MSLYKRLFGENKEAPGLRHEMEKQEKENTDLIKAKIEELENQKKDNG